MASPPEVKGFGFEPERAVHYFIAHMSRAADGPVTIQEVFGSVSAEGGADRVVVDKVSLDPYRWDRIAEIARAAFNHRLRQMNLPSGRWLRRTTPLAAYLGKELTLLAWAVEGADPTLIPNITGNWLGLQPEERWWLYTTVNASTGHVEYGRDRGWRRAIQIAFAENPVSAVPSIPVPDDQLPLLPVADEDLPVSSRAKSKSKGLTISEGQETLFLNRLSTDEQSR